MRDKSLIALASLALAACGQVDDVPSRTERGLQEALYVGQARGATEAYFTEQNCHQSYDSGQRQTAFTCKDMLGNGKISGFIRGTIRYSGTGHVKGYDIEFDPGELVMP